jgi:capsular polysaccharide transport system permease protein
MTILNRPSTPTTLPSAPPPADGGAGGRAADARSTRASVASPRAPAADAGTLRAPVANAAAAPRVAVANAAAPRVAVANSVTPRVAVANAAAPPAPIADAASPRTPVANAATPRVTVANAGTPRVAAANAAAPPVAVAKPAAPPVAVAKPAAPPVAVAKPAAPPVAVAKPAAAPAPAVADAGTLRTPVANTATPQAAAAPPVPVADASSPRAPVADTVVARAPAFPGAPSADAGFPAAPIVGWSGPVPRPSPFQRLRRWARRHTFILAVLLPTLLAATYFFGFATPQYESEARFLVRSRSAPSSGGGIAEALQGAGFSRASEEAVGVRDYLQSHDVVTALRDRLDLVGIYRRPEADPLARLWWDAPKLERLTDYYNRMVTTEYDMTSGMTKLKVRSFRPEDSRLLAQQLLLLSEELVNVQNQRMKDDSLRVAREEVARAEARLTAAQAAMTGFRDRERAVDLTQSAVVAITNLGQLEAALAQARAELAEASRFARADAPRIVQLRNRIEGLSTQVAEERQRLGSREEGNLTQNLGEYERLSTERELARMQLTSAMASLERAIGDAQRQQVFLLRVVEPNLAEWPRYPKATLNVLYVFLCLSVGYGLAWLLIAGMREHAA